MAGAWVSGCSRDQPVAPNPSPDPTLNFLNFSDGPDEAAFQQLCEQFREQTGIRVKMEVIPFPDMAETLRARIDRGAGPDVARVTQVAPYANDVLDLAQYERPALANRFRPEFDQVITAGERILAVPSDVTVNAPLINVDLFRKASVARPATDRPWSSWRTMFDEAKKIKDTGACEYAFVMDVSPNRFCSMLSSYGTNFYAEDGRTPILDEDTTTSAIAYFAAMNAAMPRELYTGAQSKYKSAAEVFAAGQAPIYLGGSWAAASLEQNVSFEWRAVPNVQQERTGAFPGAKFLIALRSGQRQQAAAKFVAYLAGAAAQLQMAEEANHIPTRRDITAAGFDYGVRAEDMAVFEAELAKVPADAWGSAFAPGFEPTGAVLQEQLQKVLERTATPEGATAMVAAAAEEHAG